jgi:hypothetical protein
VARRPISFLAAAALLFAGCGGGGGQTAAEHAAATALEGYLSAIARGDYAGACARLTDDAKEKIARRSRAPSLSLPGTTCPQQLRGLVRFVPQPQRGAVLGVVAGAKVRNVHVNGAAATADVRATFSGHTQDQPVDLVRVGNAWLVDASPNPR